MNNRHLILQTFWSLAVCVVLVLLCYQFVDRPVAYWVHHNFLTEGFWIEPTTDLGPAIMYAAPVVFAFFALKRLRGLWHHWERTLFACSTSLLVMHFVKLGLKWVFGRPWPETWIDNNPSLIRDGVYNFHWFHGGRIFGSFPSGHTTAVCAVAAVIWIAWPKARWGALLAVGLMVAALVGNDYHFVGDTVAGGFLGWIGGLWIARLLGVKNKHERRRDLQEHAQVRSS
jgi:membrane-associated phospholipid phosphatase